MVADRPDVAVPPLSGAVVDLTATLSAEQRNTLEGELRSFAERRGSQVAVLLVPTTQPETIEQFGIRVADQHGLADGTLGQILWEGYAHEWVDDELIGTARHRNAFAKTC